MGSVKGGEPCVLREPDCGEVAPAELSDDDVAGVGESVADVYGVVAALAVVLPVLLVLCHDGLGIRGIGAVRHGAVD